MTSAQVVAQGGQTIYVQAIVDGQLRTLGLNIDPGDYVPDAMGVLMVKLLKDVFGEGIDIDNALATACGYRMESRPTDFSLN
jgi:hypothetical protein